MIVKIKILFALFFIALLISLSSYSQSRNMFFFDFEAKYSDRVYKNKMKEADSYIDNPNLYVNPNIGKLVYDSFKEEYEKVEKPAWGYGTAVGLLCKYKNGLALKYGIGYYKLNERLELPRKVAKYKINGLRVPIYRPFVYYNNYYYSSLFIGLQYKIIGDDRVSFSITLEPKIDLLLSSKIENYYGTENEPDRKSYYAEVSNLVINGSIGGFFSYRLTNKVHASIQTLFVHNINPSIQYQSTIGGIKIFHISQVNYWYSMNFGILISLNEINSDVLTSY